MSADIPAPSEFVTKLEKIVRTKENLVPDQIYNFDENWLNFKQLPQNKFFVGNSSSAPGFKLNKVRITITVFLNASGSHKIQLLVPYWKSSKTKSIKNHECLITLDVFYCAQ